MGFRRIFSGIVNFVRRRVSAKFDAAQTNASNSEHWAWADLLSARASHSPAVRATLRKRSRYEAANNSWYAGILRTAANHIAGCGPRLQVLTADSAVNARIEKAWQTWARQVNLAEKLRVIVETYWRDGEVFVMRRNRPRLQPISLDIMSIESDQVASPFAGRSTFDTSVEDGIRIDPATNEIEYYVFDHHPGDNLPVSTLSGDWYSNRQVLHLFRSDRPGQVRGIPRATPALPLVPVMRRHMLATLFAAESAANQAMFMKTTGPNITPAKSPNGSDFAEIQYARNMMTILPEGWEPFQSHPEYPSTTHEMFQRITLMEAFRCTNMPYGLLCGTSKDSNLSSFRGDIKNTWQPEVDSEQDRLELVVMEPVFRWFLEEAIFAPGVLDGAPLISAIEHRWVWPPLPTLDEVDAANAAIIRMTGGLSSRSEELLRRGVDAESSDAKAAADLGMDVQTFKAAVAGKFFATSGQPAISPQNAGQQSSPVAQGEYTEIGQRAFNNNLTRVRRILDDLASGRMSQVLAEQTLQAIGLSPDRVTALIEDALTGQVTDSEVARLAGSLRQPGKQLTLSAAAASNKTQFRIPRRFELNAAAANGTQRKFAIEAYDGGPLPINGFDLPVIADLSDMRFVEAMPLLIDHERSVSATLGTIQGIVNDGRTVSVGGIITGTSPLALQVLAQSDLGQKWQASISANIGELEKVPVGKRISVNGQTFEGPVYVARHCEMFEVSVLPLGADMTTKVNLAAVVASTKGAAPMSFEDWVKSLGLDPATMSEENKTALMLAYDAVQNPAAAPATPAAPAAAAAATVPAAAQAAQTAQIAAKATDDAIADVQSSIRAAAAKERTRISQIETICVKHPQICATAIEKNWSLEQAEIAVLKAEAKSRERVPDPRIRSADVNGRVLEAALCQSRRVPGHEKQFTDQELQAAHTLYHGRIGLQQVIISAAAARGHVMNPGETIGRHNLRAVLKAAFSDDPGTIMAAAPSVLSLPGIFSNVANKELLAGYEVDESYSLWKQIAEIKSVSDYKTVTCYRMLDNFEYEELPPGGKMHHGSVGEESYTRAVKTYAKMFKLTQVDIINDDLGAFDDLRKRIGTGGAKALSNKFWAKFLDNSTFFTSARGNYITGSTTNLGTDGVGLQAGIDAFRNLKSSTADGAKRIGGEPTILMVPIELAKNAELYYVNQNLAAVKMSDANLYQGKYKPLIIPWLSDSSFTGYSATAWYLFRNPALYAPMVVSFLDGVQTPTVESADADFDELGVQFRGYHDFGCDQAEYVAGIKSKGAA